jgi:hypothetical protein
MYMFQWEAWYIGLGIPFAYPVFYDITFGDTAIGDVYVILHDATLDWQLWH